MDGKLNNKYEQLSRMYDHNVDVYLLDSGVLLNHQEFLDTHGNSRVISLDRNDMDISNDHGTHLAGIITGNNYGVSQGLRIYSKNVCHFEDNDDIYCSFSDVLHGLEIILSRLKKFNKRGVINLSISMEQSVLLDSIIRDIDHNGGIIVNSAGNNYKDSCLTTPSNNKYTISVGSYNYNLHKPSESNYGSCVDIYAPGTNVFSASMDIHNVNENNLYDSKSGTSVAAAHISAIVANYLSWYQYIYKPVILILMLYIKCTQI